MSKLITYEQFYVHTHFTKDEQEAPESEVNPAEVESNNSPEPERFKRTRKERLHKCFRSIKMTPIAFGSIHTELKKEPQTVL